MSTGVISYNGTGDVHLVLEIDGEDSSGNDTYRVSNDGGLSFYESDASIQNSRLAVLLLGGEETNVLQITFSSSTENTLGDRWEIFIEPNREFVEIGSAGTFRNRLIATNNALHTAINRVNQNRESCLYASSYNAGESISFTQQNDDWSLLLTHDGYYPLSESISINTAEASQVWSQSLSPLPSSTTRNKRFHPIDHS